MTFDLISYTSFICFDILAMTVTAGCDCVYSKKIDFENPFLNSNYLYAEH